MHDHYIACVLIIFAALLAAIPTYHEMKSAETLLDGAPAPTIHAAADAGAALNLVAGQTGSLAHVTLQPGSETIPHSRPGAALVTEPGRLSWTLVEGSAGEARAATIGVIGPSATIDGSDSDIGRPTGKLPFTN